MTLSLDNTTESTISTPFPCPATNGRRSSVNENSKPPIMNNASRRSASERPTPGPRSSTPHRNVSSPAHGPTARRSPSPRVPPSPNHRPPSPNNASRRSRSASPCIYRSNSPQLTPRSRSPSSLTRSSRLWDDLHQRSTEATKQVWQQIEEQFKRDCTFRPCINNKYRSQRSNHGSQKDAFTRLSRSNNEEMRRREEKRQKEIEEQEMASCTFRPIINPSPTPSNCIRPLEERLYQEADRRVAELARRRQENVLKEVGNLFHPQIDALSRQTAEAEGRIPIHQRVTEMQRQKQLHIHQLRMEEVSKEATFKPQINQTSRQIVEMQVAENTHNVDRASPATTSTSSSTTTTTTTPKCTFRPQLSKTTERIIRQHAAFRSKDFAERQHIYAERAKAKIEFAHAQADEKIENLFQPRITPTSEILVQAKRDIENETSKVTRLAVVDKEKSEELKQSLRDQYYSQFQFKPQLNKISQSIAKTGAAAAASKALSKAQEELLIQLEDDFKKNCTFKPTITQAGKTHPGNIQCSHDQLAERARKLAEAQREQQYEELKTCTFQPCIGPKPPDFNRKQIDIPGIDKHKERLQQAKKLEQDRKDREEQIFITNVKDTPPRYTIPKPFKLHTEYHCESKRQRREANLRQHLDKECTFEPNTNAKQAYDILRKYLLSDADDDEEEEESNEVE